MTARVRAGHHPAVRRVIRRQVEWGDAEPPSRAAGHPPPRRTTRPTRPWRRPTQTGTDDAYATVAARFPAYSGGWAALAANALAEQQPVTAYAYARTGYHRGLDALRRNGWKGHGPVPWSHGPTRASCAACTACRWPPREIGEADEAARCAQFLRDSDPAAADALS